MEFTYYSLNSSIELPLLKIFYLLYTGTALNCRKFFNSFGWKVNFRGIQSFTRVGEIGSYDIRMESLKMMLKEFHGPFIEKQIMEDWVLKHNWAGCQNVICWLYFSAKCEFESFDF